MSAENKTTENKNTAVEEVTRVSIALDAETAKDFKTLSFIKDAPASKLGIEAVKSYIDAHRSDIDRINGVLSK